MAPPKYQSVPQDDEPHYSQAPPSYEAEASANAALLSGVPRSEDDNIPDDFKVCGERCNEYELKTRADLMQFGGSVAEATIDIRMAFVRKVYAIL